MGFSVAPVRNVTEHFGPRKTTNKFGSETTSKDNVKKATFTYDYDELPVAGSDNLTIKLPARAYVLRVIHEVLETGAGYTSFTTTAGSYDSGAATLSTAVGSVAVDTTAASVGSADAGVTVAGNSAPTAGRFKTTIEYIIQGA